MVKNQQALELFYKIMEKTLTLLQVGIQISTNLEKMWQLLLLL